MCLLQTNREIRSIDRIDPNEKKNLQYVIHNIYIYIFYINIYVYVCMYVCMYVYLTLRKSTNKPTHLPQIEKNSGNKQK